jgi:hypothetical protein
MGTVIFVHGTSVRKAGYEASLAAVRKGLNAKLRARGQEPATVADCLWGNSLGVRLNAGGRSIPEYDTTGGAAGSHQEEDQALLWELLTYDPLYELHGLALRPRRAAPMFDHQEFIAAVRVLPSEALAARLVSAGIDLDTFAAGRDLVAGHQVLDAALRSSAGAGECRLPVARALVAESAVRSPGQPRPATVTDANLRDDLVEAIAAEIGPAELGVISWTKNLLYEEARRMAGLALRMDLWAHAAGGTPLVRWNRGKLTDESAPFAGDILLYQARGDEIRQFIRARVEHAAPPVVLLGHSLGGIACVDLLVKCHLPQVSLLVTVGSQAPLFYEINALPSLKYGEPLPGTFARRWVNIYDPRDFLSYKLTHEGKYVFVTDADHPTTFADYPVNNHLKFPAAHGGYWANEATWEVVAQELAAL